ALDDRGLLRFDAREAAQQVVDLDEFLRIAQFAGVLVAERDALGVRAALDRDPRARAFDQQVAHRARRDREEMSRALRIGWRAQQAQVALVHEAGGIERGAVQASTGRTRELLQFAIGR